VSQWSTGTSQIEESIHNAYCTLIDRAEHFIYIEVRNSDPVPYFFSMATGAIVFRVYGEWSLLNNTLPLNLNMTRINFIGWPKNYGNLLP
jgi:hypothetical protein